MTDPGRIAVETWDLSLYVSGASALSARAVVAARALCDDHLAGRCRLAVIGVDDGKWHSRPDRVVVLPMLVRNHPLPLRLVAGDLSDVGAVMAALEIEPATDPASGGGGVP